jgi:hypothetical protein
MDPTVGRNGPLRGPIWTPGGPNSPNCSRFFDRSPKITEGYVENTLWAESALPWTRSADLLNLQGLRHTPPLARKSRQRRPVHELPPRWPPFRLLTGCGGQLSISHSEQWPRRPCLFGRAGQRFGHFALLFAAHGEDGHKCPPSGGAAKTAGPRGDGNGLVRTSCSSLVPPAAGPFKFLGKLPRFAPTAGRRWHARSWPPPPATFPNPRTGRRG